MSKLEKLITKYEQQEKKFKEERIKILSRITVLSRNTEINTLLTTAVKFDICI